MEPVTAVVATYRRTDQLLTTLARIKDCQPPPAEILVHADNGDEATAQAVRAAFPDVQVRVNAAHVGPGGGRNVLVAAARHAVVASFDDDSYPLDADYFSRAAGLFARLPRAAVLAATVSHRGEEPPPAADGLRRAADFIGCGCVYRKEAFLAAGGYVPLPTAYGMEETDLALRLHAMDREIVEARELRVFHDTRLEYHRQPRIVAASISNVGLLAFLRYPVSLWWLGGAQFLSRVRWLASHGRWRGIPMGILQFPRACWKYRAHRAPLSARAVFSYLRLRRAPRDIPAAPPA